MQTVVLFCDGPPNKAILGFGMPCDSAVTLYNILYCMAIADKCFVTLYLFVCLSVCMDPGRVVALCLFVYFFPFGQHK